MITRRGEALISLATTIIIERHDDSHDTSVRTRHSAYGGAAARRTDKEWTTHLRLDQLDLFFVLAGIVATFGSVQSLAAAFS